MAHAPKALAYIPRVCEFINFLSQSAEFGTSAQVQAHEHHTSL